MLIHSFLDARSIDSAETGGKGANLAVQNELNASRDRTLNEVLDSMRRKPFGFVPAELFKWIFEVMHEYFAIRDDQRARPNDTSMFSCKRGIVPETGGMLSHASCLAREYGFPAVQLPDAMRLIPDGAVVTVDGDLGTVSVYNGNEN